MDKLNHREFMDSIGTSRPLLSGFDITVILVVVVACFLMILV